MSRQVSFFVRPESRSTLRRARIAKFFSSGILGRMKLFLGIALLLAMLLTTARAQQDADARYVAIYNIIQQADNLADLRTIIGKLEGLPETVAGLSAYLIGQSRPAAIPSQTSTPRRRWWQRRSETP